MGEHGIHRFPHLRFLRLRGQHGHRLPQGVTGRGRQGEGASLRSLSRGRVSSKRGVKGGASGVEAVELLARAAVLRSLRSAWYISVWWWWLRGPGVATGPWTWRRAQVPRAELRAGQCVRIGRGAHCPLACTWLDRLRESSAVVGIDRQ